jgi:DNA-binding transcriptional MerR regulator
MVKKLMNQDEFNFIDNERRTTRPKITKKIMDKIKESSEAYNDEDFYGEGITKRKFSGGKIHIHGGALPANQIQGLLNASYDKGITSVEGGWVQDPQLSTGKSKVFHNNTTGKTAVVHRGTVGTVSDWSNNAAYALGGETLYKTTDRYKEAKAVQKAAEQKYGRDSLVTLGHSQGGLQAELLGKKGDETITLNKATRPFSNTPGKNQTDIRTTTDIVSAMNPFSSAPNTVYTTLKGYNPLKAHAPTSLNQLGSSMVGSNPLQSTKVATPGAFSRLVFGSGMHSDSDSDSSSDDEDNYNIQSVLFKRPEWKLKDCKAYLKHNKMKVGVDSKKDHYRFRQIDPKKLQGYKYKTVNHGHNIQYIIAYKGNMKGGAIFGKIQKGFHDTVVNPVVKTAENAQQQIEQVQQQTQQQIQQLQQQADNLTQQAQVKALEIQQQAKKEAEELKRQTQQQVINPTEKYVKKKVAPTLEREVYDPAKKEYRKTSKYVSTKDGLATDLLYKGVPIVLGTAGALAGTMATGGPLGGMAGNYAGQMAGKMIAQKVGRTTKMGTDAQRGVGTKDQSPTKLTGKYITKKKGGLSSDLLHHGVPIVTGAMGSMAGSMLGPEASFAGSQLGSQAGAQGAYYLGKKIGVGLPKKQGRPKKGSSEMAEKMARLRALKTKK